MNTQISSDLRIQNGLSPGIVRNCFNLESLKKELVLKPSCNELQNSHLDTFKNETEVKNGNCKSILQLSLFPNVPPSIHFIKPSEKPSPLPKEIRDRLIWELSGITPKLVRETVICSGYDLTQNNVNWTSTWGKYLKCKEFKCLNENQKVNHFPGSFHIGRKDQLWLNIRKMQDLFGQKPFSFVPDTYILPQDAIKLRELWKDEETKWIIKPPASARGNGISVIHKWEEIPQKMPIIVQKYLNDPYLINGRKFDLRLYILVTSFDPLRVYIFNDGLVRFASTQYSESMNRLGEQFMHLTNYSVNKNNSEYRQNKDANVCNEYKWNIKSFLKYLQTRNVDVDHLWSSIMDIVIKTLISCENSISKLVRVCIKSRYCCYELYGFDVILDSSCKPWLLEVNVSPSLHCNSKLDAIVKGQLVKDILNTVGYKIPDEINVSSEIRSDVIRSSEKLEKLSMNRNLYRRTLNQVERIKHCRFERGSLYEKSILNDITGDDLRQLIESEDELSRCGNFVRIFPTSMSSSYLQYFGKNKYYNLLLDAWEQKYYKDRKLGIELLKSLCKEGKHL